MAEILRERPFDNYRLAITEPDHFFGRTVLRRSVRLAPFAVRILLGGRRLGKTSALHALSWTLLDPDSPIPRRAFPVLVNLQLEQPTGLDNFRYLLIARLREALASWQELPAGDLRSLYREWRRQIAGGQVNVGVVRFEVTNPDRERELLHDDFRRQLLQAIGDLEAAGFEGVCFLLDEAELVLRREWSDDAWGYLRGLKDSDLALKARLGFLLSGYRDLKRYRQRAGSPLSNIAEIDWLEALAAPDAEALVGHRSSAEGVVVTPGERTALLRLSGGHPYLLQQALNALFDDRLTGGRRSVSELVPRLLDRHGGDFAHWAGLDGGSDGFAEPERAIYRSLLDRRGGRAEELAPTAGISLDRAREALRVLAGTGVVRPLGDDRYGIGAELFERWFRSTEPPAAGSGAASGG
jgi:hypothetical protein